MSLVVRLAQPAQPPYRCFEEQEPQLTTRGPVGLRISPEFHQKAEDTLSVDVSWLGALEGRVLGLVGATHIK